jgi:hypothetical protein
MITYVRIRNDTSSSTTTMTTNTDMNTLTIIVKMETNMHDIKKNK